VIDERALISPQAELAADVTVGPFSVIGPRVRIGERTRVAAHVVINGPTTIGADNVFFQFASIGDAPQDKKYRGEPTRLEIGDRNVFRESCTVNRGTATDEGVTRVGDDNLLMAYTHIAHDCQVGSQIVMANYAALSGHVSLGDWVIMGGYSGVHQFCKVGAHAFIANNAAVTRDVPPYLMAVGQPATPHSVNSEGLKRRDYSAAQIRNIREAFRILYRRELPLETAVKELTVLAETQPEVRPFVEFIAASNRSLIR
jgi:UDP-N-acetylglucosamine acyltransferase